MLEFFKIDKDLSIYKKNEVYLFGASKVGKRVKRILEKNEIIVKGFIDNNENKHGTKFCGIDVISFASFLELSQGKKNILVQISSTFEDEIAEQLENNGILNYITYSEFITRIRQLGRYFIANGNQGLTDWFYKCDWCSIVSLNMNLVRDFYFEKKDLLKLNSFDIMLSPPKVGNDTIYRSFGKYGKQIINLHHSYKFLDEDIHDILKGEKTKLIIGVREPIKQNLSIMFEICGNEFWDLDEFWEGGGDVQKIFDNYIIGKNNKRCWYNIFKEKMHYNYLVQDFFEQQLKPFLGIDIYEAAFDKENGYSVYQFGNVEVFIYQVEKLTKIFDKLALFLEVENVQMTLSNDAEAKWYNSRYEDTQRNIILSKEYFESCLNGKYIKHFYSDKDIDKFKEKWRNNVY